MSDNNCGVMKLNYGLGKQIKLCQFFKKCFRDLIRVPRIENRVPRIRENQVSRIGEIRSLQVHIRNVPFFLKKT